jgi:hypothetical protein
MPFVASIAFPFTVIVVLVALALAVQAAQAGRAWHEPAARRLRVGLLTLAAILAWMAVTAWLAGSGAFADFSGAPPLLMRWMGAGIGAGVVLAFSPFGTRFVRGVPLSVLVGFQAFRLPLEMVMHRAHAEGLMPLQLTWTGLNWDIVAGGTALVVSLLLRSATPNRGLALAWNALGTLLLLNVMTIAVRSLPGVHAFGTEPHQLNTWVAHVPYVWLPAVCVNAAVFGHVVLWRRLLAREASA